MYAALVQNTALLVALTTLYSLASRLRRTHPTWFKVCAGLLFGAIAVAGMNMPLRYAPGVIYDGRSIVLSLAGLFGGPAAAGMAVIVAGAYRAVLGGAGVWAGLATIAGCALVGLAFRRLVKQRPDKLSILGLYIVGIAAHVVMLLCQLAFLPRSIAFSTVEDVWLPVILIFPVATVFAGLLLQLEERRWHTEAELLKNQELLLESQAIGKVGTWELDVTRDSLRWSEEVYHMFGVDPAKFAATYEGFLELVHPEDREKVQHAYDSSVREGRDGYEIEHRIVRADTGAVRFVQEKCKHFKDARGRVVRSVGFLQDITEQKLAEQERLKLQEQLQQSQRLESVGQLAGGIAHDFNNILSIILGYGSTILSQLPAESPLRADVEEIVTAGERAAALTRQLLAFSRKQPSQPTPLDLNDVIRDLEKMLRRLIGENIALELRLEEDLGAIVADPSHLEQVVLNLVVNACDAMPEGGQLLIETANVRLDESYAATHPEVKPGDYVLLTVTDTGHGMSPEVKEHIFEPFFTTKERGAGTGLGLSTVYGIVKQAGGHIAVYSEAGQGATFKVYLPRIEASPESATRETAAADLSGKGEHILVVEDDESLRRLTVALLAKLGYRVTVAADGAEALRLVELERLEPDLVLTDVIMPLMSGTELVEQLRRTRPHQKALYMSGYTESAIALNGDLPSGTLFINKPFTLDGLAARVREALRN